MKRETSSSAEPRPELRPIGDVVAALQRDFPDVTHSSLRFLEREGLISPIRTPGGHRLYRPEDVDRVRLIKIWQAQRLSLAEIRERLAEQSVLSPLPTLTDRFLSEALAGSPDASQHVLQADALGVPLVELFETVLRRAQVQVGRQWADGALRVGQEHEITEVVRELVAELSLRHAAPPVPGPPILAACVAGERHDLGLRMIVALLRAMGRTVHFLGADVDLQIVLEEAAARRPAVVLLSATMAQRLPAVQAAVHALRGQAVMKPPTIVVGGGIARTHRAELEALGVVVASDEDLTATLQTVLDLVEAAALP